MCVFVGTFPLSSPPSGSPSSPSWLLTVCSREPSITAQHARVLHLRGPVLVCFGCVHLVSEVRPAAGLPTDLDGLLAFDLVLLCDVEAASLPPGGMQLLKSYVRDHGGGLGMLGGEHSFGLGGYARTPVEELEKDLSEVEAFIAASQVCQPPCSRRQRAALVRSRSMRLTGALRSPCSGQRSRRS